MPKTNFSKLPHEQRIYDEMRDLYGSMVTLATVGRIIGVKDPRTTKKFLDGLPRYDINGNNRWATSDVAHKLAESRTI